MDTVTRNDFVKMVMRNAGGTDKKEAEKYVEAFEDAVLEVIAREQLVKLSFGTIYGIFKGFKGVIKIMKKNEFVQMIKDTEYCADISKKDIEAVINGISDAITEVIAQEDSVKLGSVGTFSGFTRPAKDMRNPRDGSTVHVPEKHGFPKFKFASNMKKCD